MAMENTKNVIAVVTLLNVINIPTSRGTDDELAKSNDGDAGLNRHEELVILSCLGAVTVMSVTVVLFLWYVVDRTKDRIRLFERHLPRVVGKFRREVADSENEHGRIVMAGTLAATGEFEGVHPRMDVAHGRVRLTSYARKQDVGIGTDFCDNQPPAAAAVTAEGDDAFTDEATIRSSTKTHDGSDSRDFLYVNGEYLPKDFIAIEKCPPPYAYDNPAYDNPYTENGENVHLGKKASRGKGKGRVKGKDQSKVSVYESHV